MSSIWAKLLIALIFFSELAAASIDRPDISYTIIKVGVRAHRGADWAEQRWKATIDYLSDQIPGYQFKMIPFENIGVFNQAVSRGELDFVLTNPASYVEYNILYGARALVTLSNKRLNQVQSEFGSVIFTRSDRDDIQTLADLKGKTLMAVDVLAFGGWRLAWKEMLDNNIDPYVDLEGLMFAGGIQQEVVYAVQNGQVDAGTVRTDQLEGMASRKEIDLSDFKIINQQLIPGFPFFLSTKLYPEWPFSAMANTDDALSEKVAVALLNMKENDQAAISGYYQGWHTSMNYRPVEQLLRNLSAGPFVIHGRIGVNQIVDHYWRFIFVIGLTFILFILAMFRVSRLNKKLQATQESLERSNKSLKDMTLLDGLTSLGNRRKLDEFLANDWNIAVRNDMTVSAIMVDIDFFKQFNDIYGHLEGDDCIRELSLLINHHFRRAGDLTIRYGGEEFLILLLNRDDNLAFIQAESLREEVERKHILNSGSSISDYVTISLGVATAKPDQFLDPSVLLKAADQALYKAKELGRNRTEVEKGLLTSSHLSSLNT